MRTHSAQVNKKMLGRDQQNNDRILDEFNENLQGSIREGNRPLLAVVKLEVGEGQSDVIRVFQGDDIIQLVQNFCEEHELEEKCVAHMVGHITHQINLAQSKQSFKNEQKQHPIQKQQQSVQSSEREDIQSQTTNSSSKQNYFQFNPLSIEKTSVQQKQQSRQNTSNCEDNQQGRKCMYNTSKGLTDQFEITQLRDRESHNSKLQTNYEKWHKYIDMKQNLHARIDIKENHRSRSQSQKNKTIINKSNIDSSRVQASQQERRNTFQNSNLSDSEEDGTYLDETQILQRIRNEDLLPKTISKSNSRIIISGENLSPSQNPQKQSFVAQNSKVNKRLSNIDEIHNSSASNTSRLDSNNQLVMNNSIISSKNSHIKREQSSFQAVKHKKQVPKILNPQQNNIGSTLVKNNRVIPKLDLNIMVNPPHKEIHQGGSLTTRNGQIYNQFPHGNQTDRNSSSNRIHFEQPLDRYNETQIHQKNINQMTKNQQKVVGQHINGNLNESLRQKNPPQRQMNDYQNRNKQMLNVQETTPKQAEPRQTRDNSMETSVVKVDLEAIRRKKMSTNISHSKLFYQ